MVLPGQEPMVTVRDKKKTYWTMPSTHYHSEGISQTLRLGSSNDRSIPNDLLQLHLALDHVCLWGRHRTQQPQLSNRGWNQPKASWCHFPTQVELSAERSCGTMGYPFGTFCPRSTPNSSKFGLSSLACDGVLQQAHKLRQGITRVQQPPASLHLQILHL